MKALRTRSAPTGSVQAATAAVGTPRAISIARLGPLRTATLELGKNSWTTSVMSFPVEVSRPLVASTMSGWSPLS